VRTEFSDRLLEAVRKGDMYGSIQQHPRRLGELGVEAATKALMKDPGLKKRDLLTVDLVTN